MGDCLGASGTVMSASNHQSLPYRETLTIWPHRSLSPRGFAIVMASLGGLAFCIGLGFFLAGAWPVIGFLGLELLVVWGAFKLNYRAARQRQKLTATADELVVENVNANGQMQTINLPSDWVRIEVSGECVSNIEDYRQSKNSYRQRVFVTSHGARTEIGAFLHPAETPALITELSGMLDRAHSARLQHP